MCTCGRLSARRVAPAQNWLSSILIARELRPLRIGICASDIEKLAREYATTHPAAIRVNYGIQRAENGGMATRAVTMLPCITGSWKEVGGGLQLSTSDAYGLNKDALDRKDLMQKSLG